MATEIELKLDIAPADAARLMQSAVLAGAARGPQRQRVYNLYFDTPDLLLNRQRMALRMRKVGNRWLQTLKTAGTSSSGLHQRGEWEFRSPDGALDLARFAATPLGALTERPRLHQLLQPAFVTDFERTTWILEPRPGQRVEVALDLGQVTCGDRTEPISEVEIELLQGGPATLFDVARALAADVSLQPAPVSKAERGYRLFRQTPWRATKAQPTLLDPLWSKQQALAHTAANCLSHYVANIRGGRECDDPEFVHQLRVAMRRLRSALRLFKAEGTAPFRDELKWIAGTLGEARDWDVFLKSTLPACGTALGPAHRAGMRLLAGKAEQRRNPARAAAQGALASQRHAQLMLNLLQWVHTLQQYRLTNAVQLTTTAPSRTALQDFAARQIRKRHKRLITDGRALATLSAEARHQVRIDAKRLRYAVDFFARLFPEPDVAAYLKCLAALQDRLGEANDLVTAMTLVATLDPPRTLQVAWQDWARAGTQERLTALVQLTKQLRGMPQFWMPPAAEKSGA